MKQKDFEARVLAIWLRSRVPLTLAHVQHLTGAPRDKSKQWLDAMTVEGVLEAEVADDGEMLWAVRGAERPRSAPETIAELERFDALTKQVASAPRALARAAFGGDLVQHGGDQKSVIASGVLSAVLGLLAPLSGVAGVYYAWRHNQTGERTGLFSDKGKRDAGRG